MRLYFHFSVAGFANSYLVGNEEGGDAILIDPGVINVPLINMIERNSYYIAAVLITHAHESHVMGIKTLNKIYESKLYANADSILDFESTRIGGGQTLNLSGIEVEVLSVPGHSNDSLVYKIGHFLFTGDVISAGRVGTTGTAYARELLIEELNEKLGKLKDNHLIFPGHGPPTTLEVERISNPAFLQG